MDRENIMKCFLEQCGGFNLAPSENEISKFFEYENLLISWNKKINLTAITDTKEVFIKHFLDSMSVCEFIGKYASVIDVGTGAGFPGIVIRIMREDISITLLDSISKRIDFLGCAVDRLSLSKVTLLHGRAEVAGRLEEHREAYDVSVSRAVAPLNVLAEYCVPFVKVGGSFLAMKGGKAMEEAKEAQKAIKELGGEINKVKTFNLDESGAARTIIEISKVYETPERYPRKEGIPSKRPL